ncbi:hypothetical protein IWX65_000988 [Arthrobacter sp. CAN_A214]|uniref:hypothetical protein n=1 Tax=Arthrobacter sp. CAN_A214 TaxID=2787720 RepID=UPI0018CACD59
MEHDALPPSMIARLLEEISWEKAVKYRRGGRGMENVLTAEVLIGLDLLPRVHFFAHVVKSCSGAVEARGKLVEHVESVEMSLLPGDMSVNPAGGAANKFIVQPDAVILSPNVFTFVEAKRIKTSAFQPEQLAQEYVVLINNAGECTPLLFLLGVQPPVSVKGLGKMSLHDAIELHLPAVLERAGGIGVSKEDLMSRVDDVVRWISWDTLASSVRTQMASFSCGDSSTDAAVQRLGNQVTSAINWHS